MSPASVASAAAAALLMALVLPGTIELLALSAAALLPARPRAGRRRSRAGSVQPVRKLAVVVPAHDEEKLVGRCVRSLLATRRGAFELRVLVVADNCTDHTAPEARAAGVEVLERTDPQRRGKGYALELAFAKLLAEGVDAIAVVDADSEVSEDFAVALVERFEAGARAVQVRYALANADASQKTRLVDLAWNAFNLVRPRGRDRLGASCGILGNGFALSRQSLERCPYRARSIVEDLEHHVDLVLDGQIVEFDARAWVRADTPTQRRGLETQRKRWEGGRLGVARLALPRLARALASGRWRAWEPLADLLLLPLSFHASACVLLAACFGGTLRWLGLGALVALAFHVLSALWVMRAGPAHWLALSFAPFYVAWKLTLLPAIVRSGRKDSAWQRTQRESGSLRVAYLVNQYPKISHAWITREIDGVEASGIGVERFSIRDAGEPAVNPRDVEEKRRTHVLWRGGIAQAAMAAAEVLAVALSRPIRFSHAAREAVGMGRRSHRGLVKHGFYFGEACLLLRRLRAQGVGHVHAHFGTNSATVAALCRLLGGPTFSFTMHGPEMLTLAGTREIRRKIALARFVVAISHHGRSQLYRETAFHAWSKIQLVRCGADALFLDQPAWPIPAEPRLVCVGRLSAEKGHLTLLESLAALAREGRRFELELIGDGDMRALIETRARELGLERSLVFSGWRGPREIVQAILAARAMVLPSYEEGLPVVFMEALALRRPVVSTYVAGIPELIVEGETGWLVPAADVERLTRALRAMLCAPTERLEAMGDTGRARVARQHDSRVEARKLARLFAGERLELTQVQALADESARAPQEVHS
jgi:glycosyltransferase involved in cell wall biosynthesis/cellulose synthase/poly-beta-1,6-N-acetylglucosamine synthase-like glycosyltransferase